MGQSKPILGNEQHKIITPLPKVLKLSYCQDVRSGLVDFSFVFKEIFFSEDRKCKKVHIINIIKRLKYFITSYNFNYF